jgi:hypothetical protein
LYLNIRGWPDMTMADGSAFHGFPAPFTINGALSRKIIFSMNLEYFVIDLLFNAGAILLWAWILDFSRLRERMRRAGA